VQVCAPLLHEVVPRWQWLVGVQLAPETQETQLPELQTWSCPQGVPSTMLEPVSVQVGDPLLQEINPEWQGLAGVQPIPSLQSTHWPPLQTLFCPQAVPSSRLPSSVHTGLPLVQTRAALWQELVEVQLAPESHGTHAPSAHTRLVPHPWPLGR
jgi:hypothetical protein